ncbi:MAG: MFS transporter, partial [Actinomycetota bacterium]|nr:MFS transporter [Actinomycetota bacterium]
MTFDAARRVGRGLIERAEEVVGGPARARVVAVLAAALGLPGADFATLSATADNLKQAFHVNNTEIGLLVSVTSVAAAAATIPIGVLTDRMRRTRLLAISVLGWAVAMLFAGAATSYLWLLLSRVALGVVTATTGPTIASLTGDFFPPESRARMLSYILGGELIGTGIGFAFSGEIAAAIGWRFAFWWLVIPSAMLFWVVRRLPEPARDGQSRLRPGQRDIPDAQDLDHSDPRPAPPQAAARGRSAQRLARRQHIEPHRELILTEDPTNRSLWWAARYVLRIRTNVVIIITSALGYFFFSGLRSFALLFTTDHYGISKPVASALTLVVGLGALAGVYLGGRLADRLLGRGWINARVLVPAVSLLAITVVFAPGVATTSLAVALPLLTLGAALLGAANPPLDAARLDIIHPALWGRAEGIRTVLRTLGEAAAPVLFGLVSQTVFRGGKHALEYTFLVFLTVLIMAGLL